MIYACGWKESRRKGMLSSGRSYKEEEIDTAFEKEKTDTNPGGHNSHYNKHRKQTLKGEQSRMWLSNVGAQPCVKLPKSHLFSNMWLLQNVSLENLIMTGIFNHGETMSLPLLPLWNHRQVSVETSNPFSRPFPSRGPKPLTNTVPCDQTYYSITREPTLQTVSWGYSMTCSTTHSMMHMAPSYHKLFHPHYLRMG